MPDLFDTLDWKPWPKAPSYRYADIPGVVRIQCCETSQRFAVCALNEDGKLIGYHYRDITREQAIELVTRFMAVADQSSAPVNSM